MEYSGEYRFKSKRLNLLPYFVISVLFLFLASWSGLTSDLVFNSFFGFLTTTLSIIVEFILIVLAASFTIIFGALVFDFKSGLVVNEQGLLVQSSFFKIEFIPWSLVNDIDKITMGNDQIIKLEVESPQGFIDCHSGGITRWVLELNQKFAGTPIGVIETMLNCGEVNLIELMNAYHQRFGHEEKL